jgi:tetratricopeptide (TPR) repeat protein
MWRKFSRLWSRQKKEKMMDELMRSVAEVRQLTNAGRHDEAVVRAERLKEKFQSRFEPWELSAFLFAKKGFVQEAINEITEAIKFGPLEPHLFFMRGLYRYQVGEYLLGEKDFSKVLQISDEDGSDYYKAPAFFGRAECRIKLGKAADALKDCNNIPEDMQAWMGRVRTKNDLLCDIQVL